MIRTEKASRAFYATLGFTHLTEEAVFDGIPLGGAGGIVADGDRDGERIDQLFLEFPLPRPDPSPVAAAAISQDQEGVGVGVVLTAVRATTGRHYVPRKPEGHGRSRRRPSRDYGPDRECRRG